MTATDDVIVTAQALDDPAATVAPTVRATGSAVVVSDGRCDITGPRLLTTEEVADPQTWLGLWGLQDQGGGVLVTLVRPDGSVMLPNWDVHLRAGDELPHDIRVTTRAELWTWRGATPGQALRVHAPLAAIRPGYRGELHMARVTSGRVLED